MSNKYDRTFAPNAQPTPPAPKKVVSIEGGRYIAARDIATRYTSDVEEQLNGCDCIAGYVVLCFDDEGFVNGCAVQGPRLPYSPDMFSEVASKFIQNLVARGAEDQ